jgi:hypothetical protein
MQARKSPGKEEKPKMQAFLLSLPEETHLALKIKAAKEKKTVRGLINEAIALLLKGGEAVKK